MTRNRCLSAEELDRPDQAATSHLKECPRCRAFQASYEAFLDPESASAIPELGEARTALDALIEREFQTQPGPRRAVPAARPFRWFLWRLAPALGVLALLGVYVSTDRGGSGVLRGREDSEIAVQAVETLSDGSVALRWRSVPGATTYRLRFFDSSLQPISDRSVEKDTFAVVPAPPTAQLFRVAAYSGTMRIAESQAGWLGRR